MATTIEQQTALDESLVPSSQRKPSILRRNRIHWHYVRDDALFSTIKVEYYDCAMGEAAPKPKASARKKKGDSASSTTPPTL
nr:hypothetical protein [Tanacetum cinerariifolium]